jgi:hypothetical protein
MAMKRLLIMFSIMWMVGAGGGVAVAVFAATFDPENRNGFYFENDEQFYDTQSCTIDERGVPVLSNQAVYPARIGAHPDQFKEDEDPTVVINPFYPPPPFKIDISLLPPRFEVGSSEVDTHIQNFKTMNRPPDVRIQFVPSNPQSGQETQASAINQYFISDTKETYTTWCINGISQQGLAAGGKEVRAQLYPRESNPNRSCCTPVTRIPADEGDEDTDEDGLGDNWEMQHFFGKVIDGVLLDTREKVLFHVRPEDDFDNDGGPSLLHTGRFPVSVNDVFLRDDPRGAPLFITPFVYAWNDPTTFVGVGHNTGKFTNLEEYVWGTNPTNPDTNGDGVSDGAAIQGLSGPNLSFIPRVNDQDPGARERVRATTLGLNSNRIVKIDSTETEVFPSFGDPIGAHLQMISTDLIPGSSVEAMVSVDNTRVGEGAVATQWELITYDDTGTEIINRLCLNPEYAQYCGLGKTNIAFTLPGELVPEDRFALVAYVSEPFTRKHAEARVDLMAGADSFLLGVAVCQDSTCTACDSNDPPRISPLSGEFVRVVADSVVENTNLVYAWYYDEVRVFNARASGNVLCVEAVGNDGDVHTVDLEVYANGSAPLSTSSTQFVINGPSVVISDVSVAGLVVSAQAVTTNFDSDGTMSFIWRVDGVAVDETSSRLLYTASNEKRVLIEVSAVNRVLGDGGLVVERATNQVTVDVASGTVVAFLGRLRSPALHVEYVVGKYVIDPVKRLFD